ncbi:MAG: glycosyltransferase [Candidatus Omnitrophica bacterium]|nr:glycosyltransferase [Candidatus Omnitrophota bacterium]
MPRQLAYVFRSSGFGGAEQIVLTMLQRLNRRDFAPRVYWYGVNAAIDARMRAEFRRLDVPVRSLDQDGVLLAEPRCGAATVADHAESTPQDFHGRALRVRLPKSLALLAYYRRRVAVATERLRQERLDIIHFLHGGYPSFVIPMIASRRAGIPVRIADVLLDPRSVRDADLGWTRGALAWRAGRGMTHVRAMSRRMRRQLQRRWGMSSHRIHVISNWVDVSRFESLDGAAQLRADLGLPSHATLVTVAARLSPEKGHAVLLKAAARIRARYPRAHYLLAGEGLLRQQLETLVGELQLQDIVHFLGFRDDIPQLMSASDLILLPSLAEGVPGTVLEGMASGKPIIATDVGGVAEVLHDQQTGRVVPPGDAAALAQALEEMLGAEPAVLARMGEQARRQVRAQHGVDSILAKLFALYGTTSERHR